MDGTAAELARLAAEVPAVYERQGPTFDAQRPKGLHERPWLERFTACLPAGGHVLDAGCGAGEPIARYLLAAGFRLTGLDVAQAMLDLVRRRFPDGDWRHGDMRTLDLEERFDGIIAWNSFFHLSPEAQRATLPRFAAHLRPRGALMLTVGPSATEAVGRVGAEPIYHASLAPDAYRALLGDLGLDIVVFTPEDPDCDRQTILLAQKLRG